MTRSLLPVLFLAVSPFALLACSGTDDEFIGNDDGAEQTSEELKGCSAIKKWEIHMNEPFDDFNDKRWTKYDDFVPPNATVCFAAKNVNVVGGKLRIDAKKESFCQGQAYTGGALQTYGKFWTGKYFKAEIVAKVPQEQGLFSAPLWFRPGTSAGPAGEGEIDLIEVLGKWNNPKLQSTLHHDYTGAKDPVFFHTSYAALGDADGTGYHTYTIEKEPRGITISIDGKHVGGWGCGHKKNGPRPGWFDALFEDQPVGWSLRIDNKVGGGWAGQPDDTTRWGDRTALFIDSIKIWRPAN